MNILLQIYREFTFLLTFFFIFQDHWKTSTQISVCHITSDFSQTCICCCESIALFVYLIHAWLWLSRHFIFIFNERWFLLLDNSIWVNVNSVIHFILVSACMFQMGWFIFATLIEWDVIHLNTFTLFLTRFRKWFLLANRRRNSVPLKNLFLRILILSSDKIESESKRIQINLIWDESSHW